MPGSSDILTGLRHIPVQTEETEKFGTEGRFIRACQGHSSPDKDAENEHPGQAQYQACQACCKLRDGQFK